jgi:SAM-dependent methyltransferase
METMPTPPIRRTISLKSRSVTPAMGARMRGGSIVTDRPPLPTVNTTKPFYFFDFQNRCQCGDPSAAASSRESRVDAQTHRCESRYHSRVAWYKEWFGAEYLELYAHRDRGEAETHIDFVEETLGRDRSSTVLDLACGAGRHTEILRQRGFRALGFDLSLTLLSQAPHLPRVAGDMCCLPFADNTFARVLNFFTSFGYFESEEENFRVLSEIARILEPGGGFLIDLFNREQVLANLVGDERQQREGYVAEIQRWFDPSTQRVNKRIRVHSPNRPVQTFVESVRAYRQEEVLQGLERAGLELAALYGSFEGEGFNRDSERLILVGSKPD